MKKIRVGFVLVMVMMLILCTFYDLQISQSLFNQSSSYGKFFETFGEIPMTFIGCFSAAAMFTTTKNQGKWTYYLGKVGFSALTLFFAFMAVMMLSLNVPMVSWLKPILVLAISLVMYILAKRVPETHHQALRQGAIIGLLFSLAAIFVITILKMLWGRMRFRQMTDPANQFTRWYLPQRVTTNNELMSFPSGHAANYSVVLWISLLPTFVLTLKNKEQLLEIAAYIWMVLVMISRVIMGAHFATDVIVGMLISMTLFFLLKKKFLPKVELKGNE